MSHSFQEGVGRDESHKEGWWDRNESPKNGACPMGGGSTNHNQGGGVGGRICYCVPKGGNILLPDHRKP